MSLATTKTNQIRKRSLVSWKVSLRVSLLLEVGRRLIVEVLVGRVVSYWELRSGSIVALHLLQLLNLLQLELVQMSHHWGLLRLGGDLLCQVAAGGLSCSTRAASGSIKASLLVWRVAAALDGLRRQEVRSRWLGQCISGIFEFWRRISALGLHPLLLLIARCLWCQLITHSGIHRTELRLPRVRVEFGLLVSLGSLLLLNFGWNCSIFRGGKLIEDCLKFWIFINVPQ